MPVIIYVSNYNHRLIPQSAEEIGTLFSIWNQGRSLSGHIGGCPPKQIIGFLDNDIEGIIETVTELGQDVIFATISATPVLYFCREVARGNLRTDELEIRQCTPDNPFVTGKKDSGVHKEVDIKGEFIIEFEGGFFEEDFYLRFDESRQKRNGTHLLN